MKNLIKYLILPLFLLAPAALPLVTSAADKAPPVKLVIKSDSVKMRALFKKHIVDQVAWYTSDKVIRTSGKADNKLIVKVNEADTDYTGRRWGPFGSKRTYRTSIEVTAELLDKKSEELWSWDGYGEHKTLEKAVKVVAKQLVKAMKKEGLLKRKFYKQ